MSSLVNSRPSALYRLALAAVAVTMAVLPCLYAALTALAVYGVYLFATRDFLAVWNWPMGNNRGTLILKTVCSCTPLLVGGAIAFSMVKPLFARRARHMQPLALNPEIEPRVFALVQAVCTETGAPAPRRIEFSCDLNASAHFERGLRGFFGSNRLILTLGLPLVAGLSQRELAGVIAHEFGHFRQRGSMRVSFLIRSVNRWFTRVVYERDGWDAFLAGWTDEINGNGFWVGIMLACAHLGVAVSRGVLWVLMMFGHAVSSALMRQMEYDADRCAITLAGSAAFEQSWLKLGVLGAVFTDIHFEMRRSWRQQFQLPDNLPVLVEYRAARINPERRTTLENKVGLDNSGWLDTHPGTAKRVRRARQLALPGYEISDAPARELFENFDALSRLVTLAHYEDDLNVPTAPDFLIPLEQLLRAEMNQPAKSSDAVKEPPKPRVAVPMMSYDPSQFEGRKPK